MAKKTISAVFLVFAAVLVLYNTAQDRGGCVFGAFMADTPSKGLLEEFARDYGVTPSIIMIFVSWNNVIPERVIRDVYGSGSILMVTLEPWDPAVKKGIDFLALLSGEYDVYIEELARSIKSAGAPVLFRFAHEMNGNWYPWSGTLIGAEVYKEAHRYIYRKFEAFGCSEVSWVFSVNWEDVPAENNSWKLYYPGDEFVDYAGIDGYNWGSSMPWSSWRSFTEIFSGIYTDMVEYTGKPVIISEFGSSDAGGDKALWTQQAFEAIKEMKKIKAAVLFMEDKETSWGFPPGGAAARALRDILKDGYFSGERIEI